jgi:hypothetical protein
MAVDWTKPIQFNNGEGCELVATNLEGWKQWGHRDDGVYPTRCIKRYGEMPVEAQCWYIYEDGTTNWPINFGYYLINIPEV